ncbi:MAG: hypothetical protein E5Y61_29655, partial [Mesorhizobium sp.]
MQKFLDILSRWEGGDLSMMEAGELLGMSERASKSQRDRFASGDLSISTWPGLDRFFGSTDKVTRRRTLAVHSNIGRLSIEPGADWNKKRSCVVLQPSRCSKGLGYTPARG